MSRILEEALRAHVFELAGRVGERGVDRPAALAEAAQYVRSRWLAYGGVPVEQAYETPLGRFSNWELSLPGGAQDALLVVGAHYDTVPGTPGADDNASGTAALLELARLLRDKPRRLGLRLAAFCTEEPPSFGGEGMGSRVYARALKAAGRRVEGMLSLEMVGRYSPSGRQRYPPLLSPFFRKTPDFIAAVSNRGSRAFLKRLVAALEPRLSIPLQHAALPGFVRGVSLSDHASFWREGFPAAMLTDTAFFRNEDYHGPGDTWDKLDYASMAALVEGLAGALNELCA